MSITNFNNNVVTPARSNYGALPIIPNIHSDQEFDNMEGIVPTSTRSAGRTIYIARICW